MIASMTATVLPICSPQSCRRVDEAHHVGVQVQRDADLLVDLAAGVELDVGGVHLPVVDLARIWPPWNTLPTRVQAPT